jgi:hypothetical protein
MVAMALNQDWPLIAGAPIPGFGGKQQAIGDAAVAAKPGTANDPVVFQARAARQSPEASLGVLSGDAGGTPAPQASQPPSAESIVVSNSTPASSPVSGAPGDASPVPGQTAQQPTSTPVQVSAPAPTTTVSPSPSPQPPVASASTPPSQAPMPSSGPAPSESPEEEVEEEGEVNEDCPPEEESDDDYDRSHGWYRGHGHGRW